MGDPGGGGLRDADKKGRNLEGFFAIDVKSIKEPWRIILQPLNKGQEPYNSCNIHEIADSIRIMEILGCRLSLHLQIKLTVILELSLEDYKMMESFGLIIRLWNHYVINIK